MSYDNPDPKKNQNLLVPEYILFLPLPKVMALNLCNRIDFPIFLFSYINKVPNTIQKKIKKGQSINNFTKRYPAFTPDISAKRRMLHVW